MTAACLPILEELLTKLDVINSADPKAAVFKAEVIREVNALTDEDYLTFGEYLLNAPKVSVPLMTAELASIRKRRIARWHVYSAPDEFVHPDCSMPALFY